MWLVLVALWVLVQGAFPCREWWSTLTAGVALGLPLAFGLRLVPRPEGRVVLVAGLVLVAIVTAAAAGLTLLSHVCM